MRNFTIFTASRNVGLFCAPWMLSKCVWGRPSTIRSNPPRGAYSTHHICGCREWGSLPSPQEPYA